MRDDLQNRALKVAIDAVTAGGNRIVTHYSTAIPPPLRKADTSYQTIADVEAEEVIVKIIHEAFPAHGIFSEELDTPIPATSEYQWLVDPMDGTENFLLGIPYFSVSVALCKKEVPLIAIVYNPITKELFSAVRGQGATRNGIKMRVSMQTSVSAKSARKRAPIPFQSAP